MSPRALRLLLALYPSGWRRRHGAELAQLVRDLARDPGVSKLRLVGDLLLAATIQRLSSPSPAIGRALSIFAIGGTAGAAAPSTNVSRHVLPLSTASIIVHRDHTGRITAVSGAAAKVVFNPTTHRVVSITRRPGTAATGHH